MLPAKTCLHQLSVCSLPLVDQLPVLPWRAAPRSHTGGTPRAWCPPLQSAPHSRQVGCRCCVRHGQGGSRSSRSSAAAQHAHGAATSGNVPHSRKDKGRVSTKAAGQRGQAGLTPPTDGASAAPAPHAKDGTRCRAQTCGQAKGTAAEVAVSVTGSAGIASPLGRSRGRLIDPA